MARKNAKRTPINPDIAPVITRPTAAPVDTYLRPAETQGSQLARALAEVSPQVGRFSETLAADYINQQRARGEQAARVAAEDARKAGEMTRMGKLPMQENPYFMSAYEEEWGRVAGGDWQSDWKSVAEKDQALQASTNMEDFDRHIGTHLNRWLSEKGIKRSAEFERGFGAMTRAYIANERLAFANGIEKKLAAGSDEALFARTKRAITDSWGRPGIGADAIARDIDELARTHVLLGRPETKVKRAVAAAIKAAALEQDDPKKGALVLDLFKLVRGEGENTLKDQSYGAQILDETLNELVNEEHQKLTWRRQEEERARIARREEVTTEALKVLVEEPSTNIWLWSKKPENIAKFPGLQDPEILEDIQKIQSRAQGLAYQTNIPTKDDLFIRVWHPELKPGLPATTVSEIIEQQWNGLLTSNDALWLINQLEQKHSSGGGPDPLEVKVKEFMQRSKELFQGRFTDPTSGVAHGDRADRVHLSLAQLSSSLGSMRKDGTLLKMWQADEDKVNQWFAREAEAIAKKNSSGLAISISKPPAPDWGKPSAPADTSAKPVDGKKTPLPPGPVLSPKDIERHLQGRNDEIKRQMKLYNIDPSRLKEFVADQQKKLAADSE